MGNAGRTQEDKLEIGPANEYLEVVDVDPGSGQFYESVDVNDPNFWHRMD
jgi:hypothetical protein